MEDLGAESLDFLDIVFKIERSFTSRSPGVKWREWRVAMATTIRPRGHRPEAGLVRLRD
jgi:hypothetical protein